MSETMTIAEMYEKYPNHWLLIADPVSVPPNGLQSGRLIFASEDRDEMYAEASKVKADKLAIRCSAKLPPGSVLIL